MTEKADRILLMTGINLNFLIGDRENRNTQAIRYRCFLSDLAGFTGLVVQPPAMTKKMDGGEGGIRTHGRFRAYTQFPIVLLRPLGHLSGTGQG